MDRPIQPQHQRRKRLRQGLWAALLLSGLALAAYGTRYALQPAVNRDEVRIAEVHRGPIQAGISCTGVVVPSFEQVLSSPIAAVVGAILLKPGSVVRPGQAILTLELGALTQEAARLEERIALQGKQSESRRLDRQRQMLEVQGRQSIQTLEVDALEARLRRYDRLQELGLVSDEEHAEVRLNLEKARVELHQIQSQRANLADIDAAELASHQSELVLLRQDLARNRELQERATVRADREGILTWVVAETGTSVAQGALLARIADLRAYKVEASVSGLVLQRLTTGQRCRVKIGRQQLEGTVEQINPAIQEGVAKVAITLDQSDHPALKPHLAVQAFVITESKDNVLLVASGPYLDEPGGPQVFVVDGAIARRQVIKPGLTNQDEVEILAGLQAGDQVIISNMEAYRALDQVQVRR